MAFLHAKDPPIIHRDLKGANILVSDDLQAKITDFGESKQKDVDEGTMTTVGTPYFMAPEVFSDTEENKFYDHAVDVYSYGMTLLEVFYGGEITRAFKKGWGGMFLMMKVGNGWRPDMEKVKEEDEGLADVISRCLAHNPPERPSFQEIIEFFKEKQLENGNMTSIGFREDSDEEIQSEEISTMGTKTRKGSEWQMSHSKK